MQTADAKKSVWHQGVDAFLLDKSIPSTLLYLAPDAAMLLRYVLKCIVSDLFVCMCIAYLSTILGRIYVVLYYNTFLGIF